MFLDLDKMILKFIKKNEYARTSGRTLNKTYQVLQGVCSLYSENSMVLVHGQMDRQTKRKATKATQHLMTVAAQTTAEKPLFSKNGVGTIC